MRGLEFTIFHCPVCLLLPETLIVHFCPTVQPFKCKSIILVSPCSKNLPKSVKKETFHNLIFGIDKRFIFYHYCPNVLFKK